MDHKAWFSLVSETMEAFHPFYWEDMRQAIQDADVRNQWYALIMARGAHPAPLSVGRMCELQPYGARETIEGTLEELVRREMLERVGEDAYRLTGPGQETIESIFGAAQDAMDSVQPLGARELAWLIDLLQRLVAATLTAPEPEAKWTMAYCRWTDPGSDAGFAPRIDQYLTDLLRFRDDAHLAAWQPYELSGPAWEALTFLWRGEARTAEELAEKLAYRNLGPEGYETALAELADRGWAEAVDEAWRATEEGVRVREEGEAETDRIFFGPWVCLSDEELGQLEDLLTRTKDNLVEMAGEGEA